MSASSIDLSKDARLSFLAAVMRAIEPHARDVPLLLVGAMARDLLLHYTHGIPMARATEDLDIAVGMENWEQFKRLRQHLIDAGGFVAEPGRLHRLRYGTRLIIDLIPFGGLEENDRSIVWPPEGAQVMTVLGYRESAHSAWDVALPERQAVRVVSLPMLAAMKLVAWRERRLTAPGKDAADLWLLLTKYLDAGQQDRLYGDASHLLDADGYDFEAVGAWLLGADAHEVMHKDQHALDSLLDILRPELDRNGPLRLIADMPRSTNADRALRLLDAFHAGLSGKPSPFASP
ncbi:nucleotidyl transferase AbiEii/AbiGii toxin family protein [Dyella marensis]|uniref:Predicted nucleotidyltransferase n=1 Tax=Dyella marensis TaxID=500610 RepID=A0A1I2HEC3_9GAMM|nr:MULTISPECIES: nucleotidyl transferase AbiEii/AbiGii toxin family protein [Dyella]SFF26891.1 Predicted nucleotidyltransferase [Dyella marensis]